MTDKSCPLASYGIHRTGTFESKTIWTLPPFIRVDRPFNSKRISAFLQKNDHKKVFKPVNKTAKVQLLVLKYSIELHTTPLFAKV